MSKASNSSDSFVQSGSSDTEDDNDKLVYSLKQGLSLDDIKKDGIVFDLDSEKDLLDFSYQARNDYFEQECLYENMIYADDDSESDPDDAQDEREPFERIRAKMEPLTNDKGVMKRIKKHGFGGLPPEKSQVTIHYNAYVEFLDEPFDSTRLRNKPSKFILDDGEVLRGLNIGIASMRQNEVAEIMVSSEYAYGAMGCPPRIPANATILYVVELLRIVDCGAAIEFQRMNSDDRKSASFDKVYEVCKAENRSANELFKFKQYPRAIKLYNKATRLLSDVNMANEEEEKKQQALLTKLFSNLSQCHLNLNSPDRAIPCALSALKCDPQNNKALFRCGKAFRLNGEFSRARHYLEQCARKEPSNREVLQEFKLLENDIEKYARIEKEFCANIFKGSNKNNDKIESPVNNANCVSDDFRKDIQKHLTQFRESEVEFLPFTAGFSDSDIEAVKTIATNMGLHCVVPERGDTKLRIYKTKPE